MIKWWLKINLNPKRSPNLGASSTNPAIFYDNRRNPYHYPQLYSPQNSAQVPQGHLSSPLTQCFWTFFWLAILIFIAYPIGFCTCQLYVILSPFSAFSSCFSKFTDFLLRLAHMPLGCTHNMIQAKPLFSI